MSAFQDLPVISFVSQDAWELWLAENHETSRGLLLKIAKKDSGIATVSYAEALDIALRYGWIDGRKGSFDGDYWLQMFTPRGPRSKWSKINCAKATTLIDEGQMKPAGLREVERAKADGRWDAAYDPQSTAAIPKDLALAFEQNAEAREFFSTLDSQNRYAILYQIQDAKKPETRAQRIDTFIAMLKAGKKIHS